MPQLAAAFVAAAGRYRQELAHCLACWAKVNRRFSAAAPTKPVGS